MVTKKREITNQRCGGKISISPENMKMGKIPSISLTPVDACGNCTACKIDCYAVTMLRGFRPSVNAAWKRNTDIVRADPVEYFKQIDHVFALEATRPRFFRWHVGGDILNQEYLNNMMVLADRYRDVHFLCFTKMYWLEYDQIPSNLSIVRSAWPGVRLPFSDLPVAWMQDGTETRVPADAMDCPGGCDSCGLCFHIAEIGRDVVFEKHPK